MTEDRGRRSEAGDLRGINAKAQRRKDRDGPPWRARRARVTRRPTTSGRGGPEGDNDEQLRHHRPQAAAPRARFEPPEPWKDADQKQLLQFLKTPSGAKFLMTLHARVNGNEDRGLMADIQSGFSACPTPPP
jgi:hypothetical protein